MLGQPSLLTILCPCSHRTPLERGQVSLWDLGLLWYRPCQRSPWEPSLGLAVVTAAFA